MISQSIQDYLKTIYRIQESSLDNRAKTQKIAEALGLTSASVTGMLKRLANMKLIDYNSYKGAKLTLGGKKIALEIIRHHRLLETYLKEIMGFSLDKVHDEACRLEHYISDEFADKISEILGNPKWDPHGHPIPSKDGKITKLKEIQINKIDKGTEVEIVRLADDYPDILAYFEEKGIKPGLKVKIKDVSPFDGYIILTINGKDTSIGYNVASHLFVRALE